MTTDTLATPGQRPDVRLSARLGLVADAQGLTTPKPTRNGGRLV